MTTTALITRSNSKENTINNNNNSKNNLNNGKYKVTNKTSGDGGGIINKMPHSLNGAHRLGSISTLNANDTITTTTATKPEDTQGAISNTCTTTTTTTPIATNSAVISVNNPSLTRTMHGTDEDFNIRFVNLVRTHKCLYDKKVPEYRNRDIQEKAWLQISQETKESVIHCKERWRNLRACLSRYIKQQNGADPQHKPYYLTEHMAFLLPFLKSTRNSLDGNNSLAALYQYSQQQQQRYQVYQSAGGKGNDNCLNATMPPMQHQFQQANNNTFNGIQLQHNIEVKHSLSDNEDEETIDAFDPAITATIQIQCNNLASPDISDTASANTLQNFIPDVQLSELQPELNADSGYTANRQHLENDAFNATPEAKRFKSECQNNDSANATQFQFHCREQADMEFFRSILPDIAYLTPQQKRKLKIGILELIDDVLERYPHEANTNATVGAPSQHNFTHNSSSYHNSTREWRK